MRDRALGDRLVSGVFDLRQPIEALQAAVRTHDGSVTDHPSIAAEPKSKT
jgi:ferric-dicitrate binding protein FerR (iron transport regulator)